MSTTTGTQKWMSRSTTLHQWENRRGGSLMGVREQWRRADIA